MATRNHSTVFPKDNHEQLTDVEDRDCFTCPRCLHFVMTWKLHREGRGGGISLPVYLLRTADNIKEKQWKLNHVAYNDRMKIIVFNIPGSSPPTHTHRHTKMASFIMGISVELHVPGRRN